MDPRIKEICRTVNGWLWPEEGQGLFELAKKVSADRVIVELGSYQGRSTACLATGSIDGQHVKVYAVDPHTGSPEHRRAMGEVDTFAAFQQNMKRLKLESIVVPVRQTSQEAASDLKTDPIGLLFIDAQHETEAVRQDLEQWFPKVAEDGYIVFHDVLHSDYLGPWLVVMGLLLTSNHLVEPHRVRTMVYFQKQGRPLATRDQLGKIWFALQLGLASLPYLLYGLIKQPFKMLGLMKNKVRYN